MLFTAQIQTSIEMVFTHIVQGLSYLSLFSSLFQAAGSSTLFAVMNEHAQGDCGNCIPGGGEALKWSAAGAHLFRRVTG